MQNLPEQVDRYYVEYCGIDFIVVRLSCVPGMDIGTVVPVCTYIYNDGTASELADLKWGVDKGDIDKLICGPTKEGHFLTVEPFDRSDLH